MANLIYWLTLIQCVPKKVSYNLKEFHMLACAAMWRGFTSQQKCFFLVKYLQVLAFEEAGWWRVITSKHFNSGPFESLTALPFIPSTSILANNCHTQRSCSCFWRPSTPTNYSPYCLQIYSPSSYKNHLCCITMMVFPSHNSFTVVTLIS